MFFDSRRSTVHGNNGMIATSQPLAAIAGFKVLFDGGNAIDACDDSLELLESLSWRYSEDPNLISNDSLIYESYRNIPKKILEELQSGG